MDRVLVTGATGFVGGAVIRRLAAQGRSVIGLGRSPEGCAALKAQGLTIIRHDLSGPPGGLSASVAGDVDAIVHCAALSAPFGRLGEFLKHNVEATRHLVAFARERGTKRFVHISTPSVYFAYRDQLGVSEDMGLPPPVNHYARTKRMAEDIVLAAPEIHPVILRPRGIYGSGDAALLPRLLKVARARPLPLFGEGGAIDLTHVDDVVSAIMSALDANESADGEIFNVSGGEMLPVQAIVNAACARAGVEARWRPTPLPVAMAVARLMEAGAWCLPGCPEPPVTRYGLGLFAYRQSLDISKARRDLGWAPKVAFEEGLERTFSSSDSV